MKDSLHSFKIKIEDFYYKNSKIASVVIKFLLSLFIFLYINMTLGTNNFVGKPYTAVALAIFSSFIPIKIITILSILLIAFNLYKISVVLLGIFIIAIIIMYLLVFRICSDKWLIVFACMLLFWIRLPYLIPLILGIVFPVTIFIPAIFTAVLAFILQKAAVSAHNITVSAKGSISAVSGAVNDFIKDGTMILWIAAIVLTIIIVNIIKTSKISNAKEIAIIIGGMVEFIIILSISIFMNLGVNIPITLVLVVFSILLSLIVLWAFLPLNYKEAQYLEFYDDEYYYFVKAVPLSKKDRLDISNNENK